MLLARQGIDNDKDAGNFTFVEDELAHEEELQRVSQ